MANRRLLICFAHPDDESFGLGGAITKWVKEGVDVYLICATNGDVGTIPDEMKDRFSSIAELRLSELECASAKLGFKEVFKLGYKDSGMMGDPTIHDEASLWYQWNHQPQRVTKDVIKIMRQIKPHVVITFNRYGGYGHPDHIAIQQATHKAWDCVSDPNYDADGLPPYQPQKLYYSAFPKFSLLTRIWSARMKGQNPRQMGRNKDIDLVKILDHVEPIHTKFPIHEYFDAWDDASACHASQGGGRMAGMSRWLRRLMFSKQGLTRVYPKPPHDTVDEDSVFVNVKVD